MESQQWCGICYDIKPANDFQELQCKHTFCSQCIASTMGSLCPVAMCCTNRSTDIIVDEGVDDTPMSISFGGKAPALLDLEEKMKCEARRGRFGCSNVARVALSDCRHHICFDCLAGRVQYANNFNEMPYCAFTRCANKLSRVEVKRIADKFPNMERECQSLLTKMPPDTEDDLATSNEIVVFCSVWGRNHTLKKLTIPKNCSVSDMLNAILQMQKLVRNRSTSSFSIYFMKEIENDKIKYEVVNPKAIGKKTVKDMLFPEKAHFIVDLDNALSKKNRN